MIPGKLVQHILVKFSLERRPRPNHKPNP